MRQVPDQPRLRKREILLAVGAGVLASGAALAILDNDGDDGSRIARSEPSEMTYQLANFERISTTGPQEVEVTFGETFAVHAEGAIGQLEVVVEDGELVIRPRNGGDWDWGDFDSTKINVTMPRLTRVSLSGTGDIAIDQIKGERFSGVIAGGFDGNIRIGQLEVDQAEFTINGLGDIEVAGTARSTNMTINGVGEIQAGDLRTQTAVIAVNGPGDVELAVEQEANVSVRGPGEVDIEGPARCTISTAGPGSVSCGGN